MNRRTLLQAALGGGALAWAGVGAWSQTHGADRRRLAVILLQGGADGLSLAPPLRDGRYLELRGPLAVSAPLPFTPAFGLHPSLPTLAGMARLGQVRLAPAAVSPSRTRSHVSDTEALLAGGSRGAGPESGWLNRAVAALSPKEPLAAVSLDAVATTAVTGPASFGAWSPGAPSITPDMADGLRALYRDDPMLKGLLHAADLTSQRVAGAAAGLGGSPFAVRAGVVGRLFAAADGPVAAFLSAGSYDTHQDQGGVHGRLSDQLKDLDLALGALRKEAGDAWSKTAVLIVTEFGRTAAANGAGGTDHGLGSAALLVGGAVRRGAELGDWPTLSARALNEGRELAAGLDVRSLFKTVLAEHWGLSRADLDERVFPGSAAALQIPGLIA